MEAFERRLLLAASIEDFDIVVTESSGALAMAFPVGSHRAEDIANEYGVYDVFNDANSLDSFNGFVVLAPRAKFDEGIVEFERETGADVTVKSYTSTAFQLTAYAPDFFTTFNVNGSITNTRRLDLTVTTNPSIGTLKCYVSYTGSISSGFATLVSGALKVQGTGNADSIAITTSNGQVKASMNGSVLYFTQSQVKSVDVQCGAGNDYVTLGTSVPRAYVFGDTGDDSIYGGSGNDTISGGAGSNRLYGGEGNDRLNGSSSRDFIDGQAGEDRIYGGAGDDRLEGGSHVDRIWASDGNDYVGGGKGNDKLYGENGHDTLYGGDGNDRIEAGYGNDIVYGDKGYDSLYGNYGNDIFYSRDNAYDWIDGGSDYDKAQLDSSDGRSSLESLLA